MNVELICDVCGATFIRKKSSLKKNQRTFNCSVECRGKNQSITGRGENNPNFGKKWTEQKKKEAAVRQTLFTGEIGKEERKKKYGKSNRGLKRSKEFVENWHKTQRDPNYVKPAVTEEAKLLIGQKSAEKFKDEKFCKKFRQTMEFIGHWVPLSEKTDFDIYYKEANWVDKMWNLVESILIKEIGIFNAKTNTKGAVRDHKLGRMTGFNLKVFPEILRHPVNCQVISHSDNVRKKSNRYVDRDDLTLEQLFESIKSYHKQWKEQEICIKLIEDYNNGKRWERTNE